MFFDMHMAVEWHMHWNANDNEVDFEVPSLYIHNAIDTIKSWMYMLSHSGHRFYDFILLEEVSWCMYKTLDMIQILKMCPYVAQLLCFSFPIFKSVHYEKFAALCILINICM